MTTRRTRKLDGGSDSERTNQLSQSEIVDAALRLTRKHGFDGLTMRGLADELGVTPMAAYYYVPNKDALLSLVVDAVFDRVKVEVDASAPWYEQLKTGSLATFDELRRYPGLGAYLAKAPLGPLGRARIQQTLQLLRDAGFDERSAQKAYAAYHTYVFGRLALESTMSELRRGKVRGDRGDGAIGAREFIEFGLDAMITGLRRKLDDPQAAPTA
ncbi:MAG: TetR/AcrR family transcriptional regulator [Acidimicrobiia bacterium]